MITKMTITNIHVIDQNSAYEFYVNKLGFKVVDDIPMGPETRWLTVSPPEQPDLQLVLIVIFVIIAFLFLLNPMQISAMIYFFTSSKCYAYMHGWTENSNFEEVKK